MLDLRINFAFFVAGRIIFELFADICPKTSDNFRALCTGREVRINVDYVLPLPLPTIILILILIVKMIMIIIIMSFFILHVNVSVLELRLVDAWLAIYSLVSGMES